MSEMVSHQVVYQPQQQLPVQQEAYQPQQQLPVQQEAYQPQQQLPVQQTAERQSGSQSWNEFYSSELNKDAAYLKQHAADADSDDWQASFMYDSTLSRMLNDSLNLYFSNHSDAENKRYSDKLHEIWPKGQVIPADRDTAIDFFLNPDKYLGGQ